VKFKEILLMKRLVTFASFLVLCVGITAQGPVAKLQPKGPKDKVKSNGDATKAVQPNNVEYTRSIIENTTDKQFLTELVDHLPMSSTVPGPDKILGYPIGTPNRLTYTKDQYRYYRELAKTSKRVLVFLAPEKSEQGREQFLIVISDEANLAKLARYKEITAKLGAHAPENTVAAFRMAIDTGCDGVEFDVRLAADGVPVVIHDSSLKGTGGIDRKVSRMTAVELARVDVGSWFNKKFPKRARKEFENETVASLTDVLDLLKNFSGLIYVEMKANDKTFAELSKAVCDAKKNSPLLGQMIVKSFRLDAVLAVSQRLPQVQTAALFAPEPDYIRHKENIIETAREFGASQI